MKRWKKIAAATLACSLLALAAFGLAACASEELPARAELSFAQEKQTRYVNWYGRTLADRERSAVIANNSASGFEVRFSGSRLTMRYVSEAFDNAQNQLAWKGDGYLSVTVDGADPAAPESFVRLPLSKEPAELVLAKDLPKGAHVAQVRKATEGLCTSWEILSLETDGAFQSPPAAPKRKIEIIGDSLSAGNGAQRDSTVIEKGTAEQENALRAYGFNAASRLGAQANVFAVSGGCVGKYPELYGANVVPELFSKYFPNCRDEKKYAWDFSLYVPDAVIVDLGTNDLLAGLARGMDEEALLSSLRAQYESFLSTLREKYPQAAVFVCCGVYNNLDLINPVFIASYNDVFAEIAGKFENMYCYEFDACRLGHPDGDESAEYGAELAEFMRSALGW